MNNNEQQSRLLACRDNCIFMRRHNCRSVVCWIFLPTWGSSIKDVCIKLAKIYPRSSSDFVCIGSHSLLLLLWTSTTTSGVTKLLVSPGAATAGITFFPEKKLTTFFGHRPLQRDDLCLAVVSSPLPASEVVCPATIFLFHSGVTPWMVSPEAPLPSDVTDNDRQNMLS